MRSEEGMIKGRGRKGWEGEVRREERVKGRRKEGEKGERERGRGKGGE